MRWWEKDKRTIFMCERELQLKCQRRKEKKKSAPRAPDKVLEDRDKGKVWRRKKEEKRKEKKHVEEKKR